MGAVLILGAKSDIAKELAYEYAENGYDLCLAARQSEELEKLSQDIKVRYSREVNLIEWDVLDYEKSNEIYQNISQNIVGVICVVGYLGLQDVAEKRIEEALKIINVNYVGCVNMINIIANDFQQKNNGFIIGISSVAGDRGRKSNYIYGSAKAAFTQYLSGLRQRLVKNNIRVLTVKPGFVNTKMTLGMNLPKILTAEPKEVAKDIFKAHQKNKNIIYTKWYWFFIMLIIKLIPEKLFKKLNL